MEIEYLTLKAVRKAKIEMESQLTAALVEFEKQTGLEVQSIDLNHVATKGGKTNVISVEINTKF